MITGNPLKGRLHYVPDLAGLQPRALRLRTTDGIELAAWEFHDRPAPATFILIHGWAGAKELLDHQIVFCRQRGWDVVAFDLRNHGQSGGNVTSLGYHEIKDLEAAIAHVRTCPRLAQTIFLWGISMGAVAAIRVATRDPTIRGIIAESSYLTLQKSVRSHGLHFFGPILGRLYPLVLLWGRLRTGLDFEALDMEQAVQRITESSVLFVAGEEDPRMPPATAHRLAQLCGSPHTRVFIAPRGHHACLFQESGRAYGEAVCRFVDDALGRDDGSSFAPDRGANAARTLPAGSLGAAASDSREL